MKLHIRADGQLRIETLTPKWSYIQQLPANSDHYWFSENGVPCFFIYTLGGPSAYHDVNDVEKNLPLTDYVDVFKLITEFSKSF